MMVLVEKPAKIGLEKTDQDCLESEFDIFKRSMSEFSTRHPNDKDGLYEELSKRYDLIFNKLLNDHQKRLRKFETLIKGNILIARKIHDFSTKLISSAYVESATYLSEEKIIEEFKNLTKLVIDFQLPKALSEDILYYLFSVTCLDVTTLTIKNSYFTPWEIRSKALSHSVQDELDSLFEQNRLKKSGSKKLTVMKEKHKLVQLKKSLCKKIFEKLNETRHSYIFTFDELKLFLFDVNGTIIKDFNSYINKAYTKHVSSGDRDFTIVQAQHSQKTLFFNEIKTIQDYQSIFKVIIRMLPIMSHFHAYLERRSSSECLLVLKVPIEEIGLENSSITFHNHEVVDANYIFTLMELKQTSESSFSLLGLNMYPTFN